MKKLLSAAVAVIALAVTTATASAVDVKSPASTDGTGSAKVGSTTIKTYSTLADARADTNPALAVYPANGSVTEEAIETAAEGLGIDLTGYTAQTYAVTPNDAFGTAYAGQSVTVTITDSRVTSSSDVRIIHFTGLMNTLLYEEVSATPGNGTVTFSTNSFSPFTVLVKAGKSSGGSEKTSPDTGVN